MSYKTYKIDIDLTRITGPYRTLQDLHRFYRDLQDLHRLYRDLQDLHRPYRDLTGFTQTLQGLYRDLLRPCRDLQDLAGFTQTLQGLAETLQVDLTVDLTRIYSEPTRIKRTHKNYIRDIY